MNNDRAKSRQCCRHANPNGVASQSPGLAAIGGLPWVDVATSPLNPNGVASMARSDGRNPVGVEKRILLLPRSQGSSPPAINPGLWDATPSGLMLGKLTDRC